MTGDELRRERCLRVFISSTFRDMQAERDELVLRVFPQIRRLCEERGVTWGEVDLRWGIPDERAAEGNVLPICLEEIRRCRPYFIGILGERYGWVPERIPPELVESEPWLNESTGGRRSVTELEILHGVLNDPGMAGHAYFYFRDRGFIEAVPAARRQDFTAENAESAQKLECLKEQIRQAHREGRLGHSPREGFRDAKELGALVLTDFSELVERLYPASNRPTQLERERAEHEAFARSRAQVYIARPEYFERLDGFVDGDGSPLCVLGESGSGKSALLANWALRYRQRHPEVFVLMHFIGGSPTGATPTGVLRRIMLELKKHFGLSSEVPALPEQVRDEFPNWLTQTAGVGRVVLILDAIDKLDDVEHALDLGWLPRTFPKNWRVIVSALPGRSLDAVLARGWATKTPPLEVCPLEAAERRALIREFLSQYGRDLGHARTDRLVEASQTSNPLYLRVLLDELRVFGIHEQLDERLEQYLATQNPYELYQKVIVRWEGAYEGDSDLVGDVLSLLWASRRGLSESELLEAIGGPGGPLPRAVWSPLFLAMADALVSRGGLLTFAHDYLRSAARDAYLPTEEHQRRAHRRLADYFARRGGTASELEWTERELDELPWQLQSADDLPALRYTLLLMPCFLGLYTRDLHELLAYWRRLEPPYDIGADYLAAFTLWSAGLSDSPELAVLANQLGGFLQKAARHHPAELLLRRALELDERALGADHPDVARDLNDLAQLLQITGRCREAEPLYERALAINEASLGVEHPDVARDLNNLAVLYVDSHRFDEAAELLHRVVAILEKAHGSNHPRVATAVNNLAEVRRLTDRPEEAEFLYRRALAIDEASFGPRHPSVAIRLDNLAVTLVASGRPGEAEPLCRRAQSINEASFAPDHPAIGISLACLADVLKATRQFAEAEPLMRRVVAIFEKSFGADHFKTATALNNLAGLLRDQGRASEAEPLFRRALSIDERYFGGEHPEVARRANNLAHLVRDLGRPAEAEPLMRMSVVTLMRCSRRTGTRHPQLDDLCRSYAGLLLELGIERSVIELRMAELAKENALEPPSLPRPEADGRDFMGDFLERTEAVYEQELARISRSATDGATKQRLVQEVTATHEARLRSALELCQILADDSVPPGEAARLQYAFVREQLPSLEVDCQRLGVTGP